jgi:hypothetical protein
LPPLVLAAFLKGVEIKEEILNRRLFSEKVSRNVSKIEGNL